MAKSSLRRLSRHEREQSGCIWSFISILDFRHGRSARKLIADRKRASRQARGAGNSSTNNIVPGPSDMCQNVDGKEIKVGRTEGTRASVKELMEEEMFTEQVLKDEANEFEPHLEQIETIKKNNKRIGRSNKKYSDMAIPKSDVLDWEIMEEISDIYEKFSSLVKQDSRDDLDVPSDRDFSAVEEKLVEAVKVFKDQRFSSSNHFGEEEKNHCSKEFVDALQTLSSNKDSFLKLLQDPNSLLVKHMQNLDDTPTEKAQKPINLKPDDDTQTEKAQKPINSKPDDVLERKNRKFFHRKSKSLDSYPTGGSKNSQSSSKIVILKPGPLGSHSPHADISVSRSLLQSPNAMDNKNTSQFSFSEIKRKLRHAMGKEKPGIAPDSEKGSSGDNLGWSSPNRNHFYTERFAKSQVGKLKDNGVERSNDLNYPRKGVSNIYIEAKKHLSEILNNGEENAESGAHRLPKSLGRILSLAEYNDSPICSPRKYGDDIFITAQMRLSPRGMANNSNGLNHEDHPSSSGPNVESRVANDEKVQPPNADISIPSKDDVDCSAETESSVDSAIIPEAVEIEETTGSSPNQGEELVKIFEDSADGRMSGDAQISESEEMALEESTSECLKTASSEEDELLCSPSATPSHSPTSKKINPDNEIDKIARPSPTSVLEPLFTEDDVSPASTKSQSADKEIQPRQIHFEEQSAANDQGICTRISVEGEESAFEYVEAVLLGSGLNWDDFLSRWLSMDEILDQSLFDEVELFSSRSRHDQKLLFDSSNQALNDICETYFGYSKLNSRPIPTGMNLIHEIWEKVESCLVQLPLSVSLDQLIKRNMEKHEKWMYLGLDIEHIGIYLGERIFDELVEETLMSFCL